MPTAPLVRMECGGECAAASPWPVKCRHARSARSTYNQFELDDPMTIREVLSQLNPDALLYLERYDGALLGVTLGFGTKGDTKPVAVYERTRLLEILTAEFAARDITDGEDRDECHPLSEAEEWIDYNKAGAYLGPDAPVIVKMREKR
jgi:hypothetical protein